MEHLQRSLDYIEENLRTELTAEELAELAGYSPSHYGRLFREATGMSVGHYILRRRLLHAGWDMSRGISGIDTALRWGFDTYAGFYRAFVREFGYTPTEYQRSGRGRKPWRIDLTKEEPIMTHKDAWISCWQALMEGYAPNAAERRAAPLVLLGSQLVCVAWFAGQEKYRELFETNRKMTLWILEHFEELK